MGNYMRIVGGPQNEGGTAREDLKMKAGTERS